MDNIRIKFYYKDSEIKVLSTIFCGEKTEVFFCKWTGEFGKEVFQSKSLGVTDVCTVRMIYIPIVYNTLLNKDVYISKNGAEITKINAHGDLDFDFNSINIYKLFGGVDNVKEKNKTMEFKCRRYIQK